MAESCLTTMKFWPRYVEVSPMASPNRSLISRVRSESQAVAAMVAGGLGGAACAAGAGFAAGAGASLPPGGGDASPGFCSSAMSVPREDSYTYHLRLTC